MLPLSELINRINQLNNAESRDLVHARVKKRIGGGEMFRGGKYEAFFIETSGNEKRRRKMGCGKWSNRNGDEG
jgi:hypothetical protein